VPMAKSPLPRAGLLTRKNEAIVRPSCTMRPKSITYLMVEQNGENWPFAKTVTVCYGPAGFRKLVGKLGYSNIMILMSSAYMAVAGNVPNTHSFPL
jgi:hypothetical protein